MTQMKAYTHRLYPSKKQAEKLQWTLDRVRELYNESVQERRDAYEMMVKRHPNFYDAETRTQLARASAITYEQPVAGDQSAARGVSGDLLPGFAGYLAAREESLRWLLSPRQGRPNA